VSTPEVLLRNTKGGRRWGIQYSYIFKNTWSGNNSQEKINPANPGARAMNNMVFTSFRYYIP